MAGGLSGRRLGRSGSRWGCWEAGRGRQGCQAGRRSEGESVSLSLWQRGGGVDRDGGDEVGVNGSAEAAMPDWLGWSGAGRAGCPNWLRSARSAASGRAHWCSRPGVREREHALQHQLAASSLRRTTRGASKRRSGQRRPGARPRPVDCDVGPQVLPRSLAGSTQPPRGTLPRPSRVTGAWRISLGAP